VAIATRENPAAAHATFSLFSWNEGSHDRLRKGAGSFCGLLATAL
jgi:hypothetical protein